MTKRLDIWLITILCLLIGSTVGSCSGKDEPEVPEPPRQEGDMVSFKFKIYTDKAPQRSRALGVWEETEANVAERILDADDMRVLILNADRQLIKSVKPAELEYKSAGISGDGYYELTIRFEDENLDEKDDDYKYSFGVVILANINSVGGMYTTDSMLPGTLFEKLDETFVMPYTWYPTESSGIPMYGYKFGIEVYKGDMTSEGGYAVDGAIPMLRAMCKIEVGDGIENTYTASDGKEYPYVESVRMTSWRDKGRLVPAVFGYENPGALTRANLPTDYDQTSSVTTPIEAHREEVVFDIQTETETVKKTMNGFRMYCPEAKLKDVSLEVKVKVSPEEEKTFDVQLSDTKYVNVEELGTDELVRNHIYRFNVNSVNTAILNLDVTVSDWTVQVDEYDVDYNVVSMGTDGFLKWSWRDPQTNFSVTENEETKEKTLSILNGTTDYAKGEFRIESPKNATWRAYLIPGENGVDAFEFVDVDTDGNVVEGSARGYAEGEVGKPATIYIRGKGAADAYRHYADLVVEVRTVDGRVLRAPLTSANQDRFSIYRENRL